MKRHFRLYMAFWRNCLRQAVEFRANFWANVFTSVGWLLSLVLFMKLIYLNTSSVAGWNEGQMFLLVGTFTLLASITDLFFYKNLSAIPTQIRTGTMDFTLLRPVNSQFFVSFRYVALDGIGQFLGAIGLVTYGLIRLHQSVQISNVLAYLFLLFCGIVIHYAVSLMTITLSFWLIRLDNLMVALETIFSIGRTPVDVFKAFGPIPPFVLTYILPLAFFAAIPVKALTGVLASPLLLIVGPFLALLFLLLSSQFWRYATRSYSSASS